MDRLWVRMGDASEYEDYGMDFDAVAEALADVCACGDRLGGGVVEVPIIERGPHYGIVIPGHFMGFDYVSLYWGDDGANGVCELTDAELDALREAVARAT